MGFFVVIVRVVCFISSLAQPAAAALKTEADALGARYPNTTPVLLDVQRSQEELEHLIQDHDVVVRQGRGIWEQICVENGSPGPHEFAGCAVRCFAHI